MNLIPIPQSTNVLAAGYEPTTSTLVVEFHKNRRYSYADVPIALFHELTDGHPHPWTRTGPRIKAHVATPIH
ncbi:UNVERIFIED_ORG: KTSC domain-containing protein [Nocardia globerula]|uniref:KTSC domain-containing protein n=1 Tax=Nocardia globerula TaxID=1818 RepID=A0A652YY92_NOCGL|nr:KTSC domain-containing protein [Nocardia globerula]PVX64960.1 KTSC domain-containing protein [Rhodococcus globerulus]